MTKNKRYVVHVYRVTGNHEEAAFDEIEKAINFSDNNFGRGSIYKVKLWDRTKGPIIPNNHNAKGLIREWV